MVSDATGDKLQSDFSDECTFSGKSICIGSSAKRLFRNLYTQRSIIR